MRFEISRADGRSNQQVVIDLVREDAPGTVYSYTDVEKALAVGTDQRFTRHRVQSIVLSAQSRLLTEHERTMMNLKGVGYKLAHAKEHVGLSLMRQRKGNSQIQKARHLLQHVRWDEMDANTRTAHTATLMLVEAVYHNVQALTRRQSRVEDALASLTSRVDKIVPK